MKNKILLCYFLLCTLRKLLFTIHHCFTSPSWGSPKQNPLSLSCQAIQMVFVLWIGYFGKLLIKGFINLTFLKFDQLSTSIRTSMEPLQQTQYCSVSPKIKIWRENEWKMGKLITLLLLSHRLINDTLFSNS